ncbi:MAG: PAS domain-containing protein [Alphaproteobacteria bacterium]|nr:PAS domain-containing protein [Alphaproteobacteria bacterium]MBV9694287.1 PAS domain-containing protein [Alphaproteobacteria bacterium]
MTLWSRIRNAALALAAGMAVALIAVSLMGTARAWTMPVATVAAAVLAGIVALRVRAENGTIDLSAAQAEIVGLPAVARAVFERLPDPLMLIDGAGRALFANRAMRGVIGIDPARKHISALLRTPSVLEAVRRTMAGGETASVEFTLPVPVERTYVAHVARAEGNPMLTILVLHDLTAMKRAEQMRADFVANASHELRTPLAALSGFIDTLKGHARDDAAAREEFLGIMAIEAERMRRLIDDLLSLTRIEQNEHVPPSGTTSLETILREAVATLTPLARAENVTLEMEAAKDLPPAIGERDELIQIFQNLIHNAIKYGRPGGHVWVSLAAGRATPGRGAETMLAVAVRDDGEGIPPAAVPRLTERFYRVDVQRSREKGGTGLGLAIVKHIVNRHQGRLAIESRAGEGSTFTVLLPAAPAAAVTEMS